MFKNEVPSWDTSIPEKEYRRIRPTAGYKRLHDVDTQEFNLVHKLHDRETEAVLGKTRALRIRALYESNRLRQMVSLSKFGK